MKKFLLILFIFSTFAIAGGAHADTDNCPNVTKLAPSLTASCNTIYDFCVQNSTAENGSSCSQDAEVYVVAYAQYQLCTGSTASSNTDCSGFNAQNALAQLWKDYIAVDPTAVGVNSPTTLPPATTPTQGTTPITNPSPSVTTAQTQTQNGTTNSSATTANSNNPCVQLNSNGSCASYANGQTAGTNSLGTNGNITYVPLEPLPGIPSDGTANVGSLLGGLFQILITVVAMIAVGAFIYGGIVYMTSGAMGTKEAAKRRIEASVWGLLLILASWLILNTINPQLLSFSGSLNPYSGSQSTISNSSQVTTAPQTTVTSVSSTEAQLAQSEIGSSGTILPQVGVILYPNGSPPPASTVNTFNTACSNAGTGGSPALTTTVSGGTVGGTSGQTGLVCVLTTNSTSLGGT